MTTRAWTNIFQPEGGRHENGNSRVRQEQELPPAPLTSNAQARHVFSAQEQTREVGEFLNKLMKMFISSWRISCTLIF